MSIAEFGSWWWPFAKKKIQCDERTPQCNFYTSVNWKWDKESEIRADNGQVSMWSEAEDDLSAQLIRVCQSTPKLRAAWTAAISRPTETRHAKDLYHEVMSKKTWAERVAYLHLRGVDAFFDFDIRSDIFDDVHEQVIFLKQGGISLTDEESFKELGAGLLEHIRTALSLCGFDPSLAETAYETERRIARAHLSAADQRRSGTFTKTKLSDLPRSADFSWDVYVNCLAKTHGGYVYLESLQALRKSVSSLSSEYIAWMCCRHCAKSANAGKLHQAYFEFYGRDVLGLRTPKTAERRAIDDLCVLFPEEVSAAFVESNHEMHAKNRQIALNIVERIRQSMRDVMRRSSLLSPQGVVACIEKIDAIVPLVGFPDAFDTRKRCGTCGLHTQGSRCD